MLFDQYSSALGLEDRPRCFAACDIAVDHGGEWRKQKKGCKKKKARKGGLEPRVSKGRRDSFWHDIFEGYAVTMTPCSIINASSDEAKICSSYSSHKQ